MTTIKVGSLVRFAVLALALIGSYAAGRHVGIQVGWQLGFASSSEQWQEITASITGHMDDEEEEIGPEAQ